MLNSSGKAAFKYWFPHHTSYQKRILKPSPTTTANLVKWENPPNTFLMFLERATSPYPKIKYLCLLASCKGLLFQTILSKMGPINVSLPPQPPYLNTTGRGTNDFTNWYNTRSLLYTNIKPLHPQWPRLPCAKDNKRKPSYCKDNLILGNSNIQIASKQSHQWNLTRIQKLPISEGVGVLSNKKYTLIYGNYHDLMGFLHY